MFQEITVLHARIDRLDPSLLVTSAHVLVNFSAPWCGLCRMIEPVLGRLEREWSSQVMVMHVDVDQNFLLAHHYKISTLPTLVLFKDGLEIERLSHLSTREALIYHSESLLHRHLEGIRHSTISQ